MIIAYSFLFIFLIGALRALVTQWLWNMLVVDHFGWCSVSLSFWTAWGILILANLIFGGESPVQLKGSK